MAEINLLKNFNEGKKPNRNVDERAGIVTEEIRTVARQYGKEYFDGDRNFGYGGYHYHPKFWTGVAEDMKTHFGLNEKSKVLDVGCAKGFLLFDLTRAIPRISVSGIDISEYAVKHEEVSESIKKNLSIGNAKDLSRFKDREFDLVLSINTLHDLPLEECKQALREIQRVGKKAFVSVDAWRNDEEKAKIEKWTINAKTTMHVDDWKKLFDEVGYKGDYYWFFP